MILAAPQVTRNGSGVIPCLDSRKGIKGSVKRVVLEGKRGQGGRGGGGKPAVGDSGRGKERAWSWELIFLFFFLPPQGHPLHSPHPWINLPLPLLFKTCEPA